jgi:hypothetical protein
MHRIELQRLFLEKGIPLRMGPEDTAEALAEAKAWST